MSVNFLDHIRDIEDPRVPGMVLYPLDELLLSMLVGLLCRAEDVDEIEDICTELLDWLRLFLPFARGIAPAQTLRRTLARLDPRRLEEVFAAWTASLAEHVRGVVAVDGKTVRGSRQDADGKGALHLVSAYAHEAGLILAQRAVDGKSNEITAIPELLDMLALEGAIVTIDAMGTQKEIARRIVAKKADYVLALKGNQGTLEEDAALGAGAVLLDTIPDTDLSERIRHTLEHDGDRISDLHLWRIGPGHLAVIVSIVSDYPRPPSHYQSKLQELSRFSHVTIEVHRCEHACETA